MTTSSRTFPEGFLWGSATASYQIEGAVNEGGRGASIWDTFSHTPGRVLNGDTGDVAGTTTTTAGPRMSATSKIWVCRPTGSPSRGPECSPAGLVNSRSDGHRVLLESRRRADRSFGVQPVATLYHWDLPQELEDAGGWTNRDTAFKFAAYAERMAQELGSRISVWTTLNEPWCAAYLGYAAGVHAPGRTEGAAALAAVHHLNLAHGLAGRAVRSVLGEDTKISVTLNLHVTRPVDPDSPDDLAAVAKIDNLGNEAFLQPMLEGRYPDDLLRETAHVTDWSFVHDGDLDLINVPLSILGVNYYSSSRARKYDGTGERQEADGHGDGESSPWVGADDVEFIQQPGPVHIDGLEHRS